MSRQKIVTMPRWLRALADDDLVSFVGIGSSTTQGTGASAAAQRYLEVLGGLVRRRNELTTNTHRHYATSADDGGGSGLNYSTSSNGGAGTKTSEFNGLSHQTILLENGAAATLTATCKAFTVMFSQGSGHDAFTVTVDGGTPVTVTPNTSVADNTHTGSHTISGLASSSHSIVITSGTLMRFSGIVTHTESATSGLIVYNSGIGGATTSTFAGDSKLIDRLNTIGPAVVLLMTGSNDYGNGVSLTTYASKLQELIDDIQASVASNPDILLVHGHYRFDISNPTHPWDDYGITMAQVASQNQQCYFVDTSRFFSKTAALDYPNLVGADDIHLTNAGHSVMAQAIYKAFV